MAWQRPWAKAPDGEHQIGEANDACVTTPTRIIGAAIGAGAHDTRCQHGPDRLCEAGIIDRLQALSPAIVWERFVRPDMAIEDSDAAAQIVAFCASGWQPWSASLWPKISGCGCWVAITPAPSVLGAGRPPA